MTMRQFDAEISFGDLNVETEYDEFEWAEFIKRLLKPYIHINNVTCKRNYEKE